MRAWMISILLVAGVAFSGAKAIACQPGATTGVCAGGM
jgi:hypothetical protein